MVPDAPVAGEFGEGFKLAILGMKGGKKENKEKKNNNRMNIKLIDVLSSSSPERPQCVHSSRERQVEVLSS